MTSSTFEILKVRKSTFRERFFSIEDLVDKVRGVFPPEVYDPEKNIKDLFFQTQPYNPVIYLWHVWLKPTYLQFPYFEGLDPQCIEINLGPMEEYLINSSDRRRIEDKWVPLEGGSDEDWDLIYGKDWEGYMDKLCPNRPELPKHASLSDGSYEFRYIVSIE